jgi:hypothetical protein
MQGTSEKRTCHGVFTFPQYICPRGANISPEAEGRADVRPLEDIPLVLQVLPTAIIGIAVRSFGSLLARLSAES